MALMRRHTEIAMPEAPRWFSQVGSQLGAEWGSFEGSLKGSQLSSFRCRFAIQTEPVNRGLSP